MSDVYFIAYDISNNKLRKIIEKTLKNYGVRIQYSVFQCFADAEQVLKISDTVKNILKNKNDHISESDSIIIIGGVGNEKVNYFLGKCQDLTKYAIY